MDENDDHIPRLLAKYARRESLSDKEWRTLENWWKASPENEELARLFADEAWVKEAMDRLNAVPRKEIWAGITRRLDEIDAASAGDGMGVQSIKKIGRRRLTWSLAAAGLLAALVSIWLYVAHDGIKQSDKTVSIGISALVAPNERDAIWMGSDGHKVLLSAVPVGGIVWRLGVEVLRKVDSNTLAYDAGGVDGVAKGSSVLMTGSICRPYQLRLSEGSVVWLDRASVFRYCNNSRDDAHPYSLAGNAFFSIAKSGGRPFIIGLSNGNDIRVTGTELSATSYPGQSASKVCLFSGSLSLVAATDTVLLAPGEEAIGQPAGVMKQAIQDRASATGWLGGSLVFHFDHTELATALARVATWYGLTISNPHQVRGKAIGADLPRSLSPEGMLACIANLEGHFARVSMEKNEIVVSEW